MAASIRCVMVARSRRSRIDVSWMVRAARVVLDSGLVPAASSRSSRAAVAEQDTARALLVRRSAGMRVAVVAVIVTPGRGYVLGGVLVASVKAGSG